MFKKVVSTILSCSIALTGILSVSIFASKEVQASTYNELGQRPFMGWSSWSSIRKNPTEKNIKAAADVLAEKFKSHGYQYVNLDDYYMLNWTTTVDKYGRWVVDPKKFPHGMKALGDYIHNKGLHFGSYVTLGIPKAAVDQNTPIEGTPYHAKDIVDFSKGQKVNFNFKNMYSIDFSKPGAQEYIDSWARLFASYGVDYLKIDGVRTQDIKDIEAWAKALKKTGRPIHVELSNNLDIDSISFWQDLANGWRTDHDVESYGKPTNTDWEHVARRFNHAAKWQPHAGPGGWNDFDSLNVANGSKDGLTDDEKRSHVSLWAIAASHFAIGSDMEKLDDFGISLLTNDEIIAANQSGAAGKRLYKTSNSQVFYQSLPDGSYNVGLFNTGPSTKKVSVPWEELGFKGSADVRDMWSHKDIGSMKLGFTALLATHASRMIHVVPDSSLIVSPKSGETDVNPSQVSLTWKAPIGAEDYHVLAAKDPDFSKVIYDQIVSSTSTKLKNLETDGQYFWKVSSFKNGKEKLIGIYSFHTKMTKSPAAPDWVIADRNNKDSISLTWNPTFGADSYTVYRKKVNGLGLSSGYKQIATDVNDPNYTDHKASLQHGGHYSYMVTAHNAVGESAKSIEGHSDKQSSIMVRAISTLGILLILIAGAFFIISRRNNNKPTIQA